MSAIDCPCGQRFEAASDEELVRLCLEHVEREHPDMRIDAYIREHVTERDLVVGEPLMRR
jgi:hypothetical protein